MDNNPPIFFFSELPIHQQELLLCRTTNEIKDVVHKYYPEYTWTPDITKIANALLSQGPHIGGMEKPLCPPSMYNTLGAIIGQMTWKDIRKIRQIGEKTYLKLFELLQLWGFNPSLSYESVHKSNTPILGGKLQFMTQELYELLSGPDRTTDIRSMLTKIALGINPDSNRLEEYIRGLAERLNRLPFSPYTIVLQPKEKGA
ncbi:MAG: hypothetical protein NZL83_04085 [Candidatus Absconditabacterales bacterium]|nr:hypothetical protein [Candidatus Absconditabacterales bacterium]